MLKGGISIDADSGPLRCVIRCCGSRSQEEFTFIQIDFGHTVGDGDGGAAIVTYGGGSGDGVVAGKLS